MAKHYTCDLLTISFLWSFLLIVGCDIPAPVVQEVNPEIRFITAMTPTLFLTCEKTRLQTILRLTTPLEEAKRQAESFDFTWTHLAVMAGIILLTWLLVGEDYWRRR